MSEKAPFMVFSGTNSRYLAEKICASLDCPLGKMNITHFADGEFAVSYEESIRGSHVFLVQSTFPNSDNLMELLLMVDAAKRATARRIVVVLPYYMYSRSDKKDQPRIPVTAKLFAQLIEAAGANRVLTCDLHNPAIQAYFNINCDVLTGEHLLEKYFDAKNIDNKVVVATDAGSSKKAYKYAEHFSCPIVLVDKRRDANDDRAISTSVIGDIKGKNALVFDDEVDTAGSIMETVEVIKKFGAKDVYVGCTHGVLSDPAIERIKNSEIKELVMTNTIPLPPEKQISQIVVVSMSELFAEAIKRINEATSIGELFEAN